MDAVLYCLCRHCVGLMNGYMPYPARLIAENCGISLSTARRRLRKLKADGYTDTITYHWDEQEEPYPPYHGWTVTPKAYDTPEYKAAWKEEKKICREVFGEDMFPSE